MHLMYTLDPNGKRIYTLKKIAEGEVTKSAHPARFSPDDKYSRYAKSSWVNLRYADHLERHRVTLKKRYGLLRTQQSKFGETLSVECVTDSLPEDVKVLGQ